MNTHSVGQHGAGDKVARIGVSLADIKRAGVDPQNARLWHVTDGVEEVPTGAFAGIDVTDTELSTRTAGELYMVRVAGTPCLRHLAPMDGRIGTAFAESGPYTVNPAGSVQVIGRVFWFGRFRYRWQPE